MNRPRIFIDGHTGTTGLDLVRRLSLRDDLELIHLEDSDRRVFAARLEAIRACDLAILCLPDKAAEEIAAAIADGEARLLDASTRHRTARGWTFGLPELAATQRAQIERASRVSNPGCYATGFILSIRPLVEAGVLATDARLTVHALSGYSGGGKQMIARYRQADADLAVRPYALDLNHKHLPEMRVHVGLDQAPLFSPMVGNYYKGMITQTPIFRQDLRPSLTHRQIYELLAERYDGEPFITVYAPDDRTSLNQGQLAPDARNDSNQLDLFVFGSGEHALLTARFDNLGKGACGAAIQNLNLMLGIDECTGLTA